jgi:hypothetical protein
MFKKKTMKEMQLLLAILLFSLVSYLAFKVNEGLCTKTTTCNQCNNCKKQGTHWGWPTFF